MNRESAFTLVEMLVTLAVAGLLLALAAVFLTRAVFASSDVTAASAAGIRVERVAKQIRDDIARQGELVAFTQGDAHNFSALFSQGASVPMTLGDANFTQGVRFTLTTPLFKVGDLALIRSNSAATLATVTDVSGLQVTINCPIGVTFDADGIRVSRGGKLAIASQSDGLYRSLNGQPPTQALPSATPITFHYEYRAATGGNRTDPSGFPAARLSDGSFLHGLTIHMGVQPRDTTVANDETVDVLPAPLTTFNDCVQPGGGAGGSIPGASGSLALRLSITGLPSGTTPNVTLGGPGVQGLKPTASTNYTTPTTKLQIQSPYTATAQNVTAPDGTVYQPTVKNSPTIAYNKNATLYLQVDYQPAPAVFTITVKGLPAGWKSRIVAADPCLLTLCGGPIRGGGLGGGGGGSGSPLNPTLTDTSPGDTLTGPSLVDPPNGTYTYQVPPGNWSFLGQQVSQAGKTYFTIDNYTLTVKGGTNYNLTFTYKMATGAPSGGGAVSRITWDSADPSSTIRVDAVPTGGQQVQPQGTFGVGTNVMPGVDDADKNGLNGWSLHITGPGGLDQTVSARTPFTIYVADPRGIGSANPSPSPTPAPTAGNGSFTISIQKFSANTSIPYTCTTTDPKLTCPPNGSIPTNERGQGSVTLSLAEGAYTIAVNGAGGNGSTTANITAGSSDTWNLTGFSTCVNPTVQDVYSARTPGLYGVTRIDGSSWTVNIASAGGQGYDSYTVAPGNYYLQGVGSGALGWAWQNLGCGQTGNRTFILN